MSALCSFKRSDGLSCLRLVRECGDVCALHHAFARARQEATPAPGLLGTALRVLRDPETGEPMEVR